MKFEVKLAPSTFTITLSSTTTPPSQHFYVHYEVCSRQGSLLGQPTLQSSAKTKKNLMSQNCPFLVLLGVAWLKPKVDEFGNLCPDVTEVGQLRPH